MAHWQDYSAAAAGGVATLGSAVPHPGEAFLGQALAAGDSRGATVTFRGDVRAEDVTDHAELFLFIVTTDRRQDPDLDVLGQAIAGSHDWASYEVTAQVPGNAELIQFGLTLTGPGRAALRNLELTRTS